MAKLIVYNNVSLDGYFTGENGDIGWFKDLEQKCRHLRAQRFTGQKDVCTFFGNRSPQYLRIHGSRLREENELEK
jgi:hypothetical protein